ncbi:isoprenylcysteine carboxylmethyltransferase family protein [Geodermatophilus sp. DF01-2]|uniref:isoprenylcysteine carboxylmethyltransferase family protein n=1 Tax=Geodermatophilus sp. DF01-2 TaxID=2559610 RepID=UPI00107483A1|nr:isoprenylcysteine carboxylmethyltransferase family protein [Geodermatophilus sp. DF01_2]TFV64494.1 isoprenylcysteine carboxylmethyltransferase family protein [Geodermatophilus sp. DF01_2]
MIAVASLLHLAGLGVVFGVCTWLQIRRTGGSGFNGISGPVGSLSWWAGVLFVLALLLGLAGPAVVLAGVMGVPDGPTGTAAAVLGLVLLVPGVAAVLIAQTGMGTSWRIGVDDTERTDVALACLILAIELQVRVIEELYLRRVHGADYVAYAARTGRFLPGFGRLHPRARPVTAR